MVDDEQAIEPGDVQNLDVGSWTPAMVDPIPDKAPDEVPAPEPGPLDGYPPEALVTVIYRGDADVADLKGADGKGEHPYVFRNGEPVQVPSSVAQELLTWPFEQFEVVKE